MKKEPERSLSEVALITIVIITLTSAFCAALVCDIKKDIEHPEKWTTISGKSFKRER